MKNGIQTFCEELGKSGCYALSLLDVAEEFLTKEKELSSKLNVVSIMLQAVERGFIIYDWGNKDNPDNFYVEYPANFLEAVTGRKWEVRKEPAWYQIKENEYKINRWERISTGVTTAHFERDDFHPINNSLTVKEGKIKSTRICKVLN